MSRHAIEIFFHRDYHQQLGAANHVTWRPSGRADRRIEIREDQLDNQNDEQPVPYIKALQALYGPLQPYSLTIIRVCLGVYLMRHGYPKVFEGGTAGLAAGPLTKLGLPSPMVWAYLVAAVEFGGGLLITLGLLTRLAAAAAIVEFAVIVLTLKFANGFFAFAPKAIQPGFAGVIPGGFELELLLGLLCLVFVIAGGGRVSVDRAIGREI